MKEQSQEIIDLADGVRIIDDALNQFGIDTLEGRVGPLLFGDAIRSHYIDMPANSYLDEHPHPTESLAVTLRGNWVMCANGRRHLMGPGSMYWFGGNIPTGYEVPFDEPAYLLVFKGGVTQTPAEMLDGVENGMKLDLIKMKEEGVIFRLRDLPPDHPARVFAHKVNPALY